MAKCENCGAELADHEPRCSHCGAFQYPGAEKEYWSKVRKIHHDLKDLEEVPKEAYESEVRGHVRKLGIRLGIGTAVLAAAISGWMIYSHYKGEKALEAQRAQLVWQKEQFPRLDAWYAQGDYDAILEFERQIYEEDSPYHIWNWEHAAFVAGYDEYCQGKDAGRILKNQEEKSRKEERRKMEDVWLEGLLYSSMSLKCRLDSRELYLYTEDEVKLLREYQEELWKLTGEIFELTDEELEDIWSEVSSDGIVSYKACQTYVKKWKKGG